MSAKEARLKKIKDEAIGAANHDEVKHVVDVSSELVPSRGKVPGLNTHNVTGLFVCLFGVHVYARTRTCFVL